MQYAYLMVEGYTDLEFLGRLLRNAGFSRIMHDKKVPTKWQKMIPQKPFETGDLTARIRVPAFFCRDEYSVAIYAAGNLADMLNKMRGNIINNDWLLREATGIGFFVDADFGDDAVANTFRQVMENFTEICGELGAHITPPGHPGVVEKGSPNLGVFIMPDNESEGTIEDLILTVGDAVYNDLKSHAKTFLGSIDKEQLVPEEKEGLGKPAGENKALVGCMANVLKPGKSTQVSVQDNRWICEETIEVEQVKNLLVFVNTLLGI